MASTLDVAVTIPNHAAFASTIAPTSSTAAPSQPLDDPAFRTRYALGDPLGEGGMGVVRNCRDARIGREVAMKTVRAGHGSRSDLVARFLREACVQGQLEHPSIVPVYDLGRDPDGQLYFTMKRVHGATFDQIVERLRSGDAEAQRRYSRRKLLTAFASVCQAVHFAHARGVVHRDIKPGNVMLGDFGEVYVLDWGLAKIATAADPHAPEGAPAISSGSDPGAKTVEGATMGTPGYMAPEQVRGASDVDARADVYALGAILFELLSLEPLHTRDSIEAAMTSTLAGVDARPGERAPHLDVPPELDAICARACSLEPDARFAAVREMVDAIERYLDGDRDTELRREMARDHARSAADLAQLAIASGNAGHDARTRALRDVGRALALDPQNADAARTLLRLFTEPPREMPVEARTEMRRLHERDMRASGRVAAFAFLSWFVYGPICWWMGIRDVGVALGASALFVLAAAASWFATRRPQPDAKVNLPMLIASCVAIGSTATILGPYFLTPGLAVMIAMMFIIVPPNRARQWLVAGATTAAIAVPAALSWLGVLPRTYEIHDDAITIHASMLHFPALPTEVFLLFTSVAMVVTAVMMVTPIRRTLTRAEERLQVQAWQLKQLLPREAHMSSEAPADEPVCVLDYPARANSRA